MKSVSRRDRLRELPDDDETLDDEEAERNGGTDLRGIAAALARRKWVILAVAALVTAGAGVQVSRAKRTYSASASVQLTNVRDQITRGIADDPTSAPRADLRVDPFAAE